MIRVKQNRFYSLDSFKILNQPVTTAEDSCNSSLGVGSSLSDLNTPSLISYNVLLTQKQNLQKANKTEDFEKNYHASKSFTVSKNNKNLSSTSPLLNNNNYRTLDEDELKRALVKPSTQINGNGTKIEEENSIIIMNNDEDKISYSSGSVSHFSVPHSYCK